MNSAEEIARRMLKEGRCHLSWVLRNFDIPYRHAVDILNELERVGIVSPFDGTNQRKLLVTNEKELSRKLEELNG